MGNSHQLHPSQVGKIVILTDKVEYQAGETIMGEVFLLLKQDYYPSSFRIEVYGKQSIRYKSSKVNSNQQNRRPSFTYGTQSLLPVNQHLWEGAHGFPFKIKLSEQLMPSFLAKGKKNFKAKIDYKIRVLLQHRKNSVEKKIPDLMQKQKFIVMQCQIPKKLQQFFQLEKNIKCTFLSMGTTSFQLSLQKEAYRPDECIELRGQIQNSHCNKAIDKFRLELFRTYRIVVKRGHGVFGSHEIQECLGRKEYPGIEAKMQDVRFFRFPLGILQRHTPQLQKYLNKKHLDEVVKFLYLQKVPTTFSEILECSYFVKFSVVMTNPRITSKLQPIYMPVHILPSSVENYNYRQIIAHEIRTEYPDRYIHGERAQLELRYVSLIYKMEPVQMNVVQNQYVEVIKPNQEEMKFAEEEESDEEEKKGEYFEERRGSIVSMALTNPQDFCEATTSYVELAADPQNIFEIKAHLSQQQIDQRYSRQNQQMMFGSKNVPPRVAANQIEFENFSDNDHQQDLQQQQEEEPAVEMIMPRVMPQDDVIQVKGLPNNNGSLVLMPLFEEAA